VSHRIRRSRQDRFVRVVVYVIVTLIVVGMIGAMVGSALAAPVGVTGSPLPPASKEGRGRQAQCWTPAGCLAVPVLRV